MGEVDEFVAAWKVPGVDRINVKPFDSWGGQIEDINALSTEDKPTQQRYACPNLWYHTHVYWDGRIAMCDRDFNLAYDLGNVRSADGVVRVLENWNGPKMQELRRQARQGRDRQRVAVQHLHRVGLVEAAALPVARQLQRQQTARRQECTQVSSNWPAANRSMSGNFVRESSMTIRKIVLIQPGRDGRKFGRATSEPYTLMRLASLVPLDIPVEIWDEDLMRLPIETLGKGDLVGITAKTLLIDRAKVMSRRIQAQGATVIMGGTHTTLVPEEVEGWADAIAVGEGYRTWPQIIRDFDAGTLQPRYVDEEWAPLDSGVANLQDRVLKMVDEHRNYWTPYLEITRGCPRSCTFCTAIRVSGQKMRLRPVGRGGRGDRAPQAAPLLPDRRQLRAELPALPGSTWKQLFRALAKLPLDGWTAQAEQMVADHPDLLDLAREAHLDKFFIGFESINPGNRKELGGKARGDVVKSQQVIDTVQKHGIGVVGLFVYGFDSDTPDIFPTAWEFIRNSGLDSVSATILTPYPGTVQRKELLAQGRILPHDTWEKYNTNHVTYVPAQMTVEELQDGYDWLCRRLYSPSRDRGARAAGMAPALAGPGSAAPVLQLQHRCGLSLGNRAPVGLIAAQRAVFEPRVSLCDLVVA